MLRASPISVGAFDDGSAVGKRVNFVTPVVNRKANRCCDCAQTFELTGESDESERLRSFMNLHPRYAAQNSPVRAADQILKLPLPQHGQSGSRGGMDVSPIGPSHTSR